MPDFNGRKRSFALPEFDPFWKRVEEADILVGMHASDSGTHRYVNEFEGRDNEFLPFAARSGFIEFLGMESRMISDVLASVIGHGMATRFPKLRILPVENGSAWVRPLLERLEKVYERKPELFDEDPVGGVQAEHLGPPVPRRGPARASIDLIGVDKVCFGSDYPAPGGPVRPAHVRRRARGPAQGRPGEDHGRQPRRDHEGRGLGISPKARWYGAVLQL